MKVPLLDLEALHKPIHREIMDALERVVKTNGFILGPEVENLEKAVAKYCGTQHAIGVSSGTDALLIALMVLGIGSGDEVITTPYTFFATAGAIVRAGAKPVFVDIEPSSFNIDTEKIKKAITPRTKAIIPVHLYGQCADMDTLMKIAREHKLAVIEDAAQAIGTEGINKGEMTCFSFFPSKNLGALGDGGMVTTNSAELAEKLKVFRVHGSKPKYFHAYVGGNFRLDALQAAALNVKLPHLNKWTDMRKENAQIYDKLFGASGLVSEGFIKTPVAMRHHIYNQYVIRVKQRDAMLEFLKKNDIGSEIYYPVPLHLQTCFKSLGYLEGYFPESERAAKETLALPIYPGLTKNMQEFVVQTIRSFYGGTNGHS